ncbi:hypothetical protein TL16_g11147, partial [Triparma laevis f. inornata]
SWMLCRGWGPNFQSLKMLQEPDAEYPSFGSSQIYKSRGNFLSITSLGSRCTCSCIELEDGSMCIDVYDVVNMFLISSIALTSAPIYAQYSSGLKSYDLSLHSSSQEAYILSTDSMHKLKVLDWKVLVDKLIEAGEWLNALSLCLQYYETRIKKRAGLKPTLSRSVSHTISNHPFLRYEATLVIPRHEPPPRISNTLAALSPKTPTEEEEVLCGYLRKYIQLAFENAPPKSSSNSHYRMLASVCIEFCVVTERLDVLFKEVFRKFVEIGHGNNFVDLLEPEVVGGRLRYISPEVMNEFVEYCRVGGDLRRVERCLLHMDVKILDFDSVLKLLRKNKLYTALLHIYTSGLNDFVTPLQMLYEDIFDSATKCEDVGAFERRRREEEEECKTWFKQQKFKLVEGTFEYYGGMGLLYARRCLKGERWPRGGDLGGGEEPRVRSEVMKLFCEEKYLVSKNPQNRREVEGYRAMSFPYIRMALLLDARAALDLFAVYLENGGGQEQAEEDEDEEEGDETTTKQQNDPCSSPRIDGEKIVEVLINVFSKDDSSPPNSPASQAFFLSFVADMLEKQQLETPAALTHETLSWLATKANETNNQGRLVRVLNALQLTPNSYRRDEAISAVKGHNRAEIILFKGKDGEQSQFGEGETLNCEK